MTCPEADSITPDNDLLQFIHCTEEANRYNQTYMKANHCGCLGWNRELQDDCNRGYEKFSHCTHIDYCMKSIDK